MTAKITRAIALAAGFGTRLRPITDHVPKAMVTIAGKPLLDYALDHLRQAGVKDIVVNTHYLAQVIHNHLKDSPGIIFSHEAEILETGGGIQNILPHFNNEAFFAVNADSLWVDKSMPILEKAAEFWDDTRMDALLLLLPNDGTRAELIGDFDIGLEGRLKRGKSHIYIGAQILHPRLFDGARQGKYSLNILYNKAAESGRLYGIAAKGIDWFHISTPKDREDTERHFKKKSGDESL